MDKEFKTTFIPKKNLAKARVAQPSNPKTRSLLGLLALLLFVTALVSSIGVYVYKLRVAAVINSRVDSINRAEKAFEPAIILELRKLDIRLRAATELLDQHIALSDFFDSLGETTLPDISFNDFQINFDEETPSVSMSGTARGYVAIAQQSELFGNNQYIENAIFSDFALNETGLVSFSLEFTLNRNLLKFGRTASASDDLPELDDNVIIEGTSETLPSGVSVDFTN